MVIRPATMDDVPRIVEMAQRFYPASGYDAIGPMTKESAAGLAIITMESGVMLVAEHNGDLVGMACIALMPFDFNPEILIGNEVVFWVEPEHRGGMLAFRLAKAADAAVEAKGARANRMATLASSPPQAAALFARIGYVPSETYHTRIY